LCCHSFVWLLKVHTTWWLNCSCDNGDTIYLLTLVLGDDLGVPQLHIY